MRSDRLRKVQNYAIGKGAVHMKDFLNRYNLMRD